MQFHNNFLKRYLRIAPAALALERSIECGLHVGKEWPAPILDIGCGDGIFADILFAGKIDTGIDPDASEVERARPLDKYNELIVCFGDDIPKADGTYNTVFSNSVLEHIPDLMPVLQEVHRLMSDTARFYITIPTDKLERATFIARLLSSIGLVGQAKRYGQFYNRFWKHYNVHTLAEWRQLFEQAGFEVEVERPYVPVNTSTLYDLLTPLALPALIAKKLFRRWLLLPALRPFTAPVMATLLSGAVDRAVRDEGECLVYYSLRKRPRM
ncbi:class I SAM-dependent methyltransferase [Hoeflea sp. AS16]|uniref:class I SAM-dependent methyltransferase n=1 Tax=Hoeflea sp. AS16 TaxID=3135779 RepID=UPI003180B4E2